MFPVKFTPLSHTNKDVFLQSRFSWACFRRPGCLFLSRDLATLAVTLIFGALSFMTAPACVVAVCHLSFAMLTWNIPCCLVNTTANPVSHHVVADRTHFPSNILANGFNQNLCIKNLHIYDVWLPTRKISHLPQTHISFVAWQQTATQVLPWSNLLKTVPHHHNPTPMYKCQHVPHCNLLLNRPSKHCQFKWAFRVSLVCDHDLLRITWLEGRTVMRKGVIGFHLRASSLSNTKL